MEINTNSWHYRLVSAASSKSPSTNLCNYFWQVVWASTWLCIMLFGGVWLSYILLFPLLQFFVPYTEAGTLAAQVLSSAFWVGLGFVLYRNTEEFEHPLLQKELFSFKGKNKVDKKPNILVEYIKAKKSKWCPVITFIKD